MRVTIRLDDDVAAAVERLRREERIGFSEAVNRLARAGLASNRRDVPFPRRTHALSVKVDISCIQGALDLAEGPMRR